MKHLLLIFFTLLTLYSEGISVQFLNDVFYNTDEQRTGGFKVLYQSSDEWSFHIGQDVYTPHEKETLTPIIGERPYNAWLYMGLGYQVDAESYDTLFSFKFDVGSRGPRALGKNIQNSLHELINSPKVLGWDSQTKNEYGNVFAFTAEHSLLDLLIDSRRELTHISTYISTEAGTIWRTYTAGVSLAFGYNTPYYNSLINFPEKDTFYAFGNLQVTYVDKNNLLDGNSNYNVIREKNIKKYDIGLNWDNDDIRFRFTLTTMSKEFTTQKESHRFGLLEITLAF